MTDNEILTEIKYRVGIFYNDEQANKSVTSMIDGCKQHLVVAGVDPAVLDTPLAVDLYTMWVSGMRNGNFAALPHSAAFIGLLVQLKNWGSVLK